ncbi:chromate reductase [Roseivivax marinus]|uniref:NADPH-dependent FMN reductase n=1 Tax=Roseivivax marinus TaxID=1379903 RepID=UPI0008BB7BD6|nr:NADPH-dependent FMN reductase [Roseivivax marinus]SEK24820.1 chromate reductase [Roseivivax marinus]
MSDLRLLGLCGALRAASTNRLLLHEAARRFGPAHFAEADLRLPLFDGDLEAEGIPPEVQALSDQIAEADAVIVCTPEYNKGVSGVLKNALDWVSRTKGAPWRDKPVAILSATSGVAGGHRAQTMLRACLNPFRPLVLPGPEVFVGNTSQKWDEDGRLTDEVGGRMIDELMGLLREAAEDRRARG